MAVVQLSLFAEPAKNYENITQTNMWTEFESKLIESNRANWPAFFNQLNTEKWPDVVDKTDREKQ